MSRRLIETSSPLVTVCGDGRLETRRRVMYIMSDNLRIRIVDRQVLKLNLREAARREAQRAQRGHAHEVSKRRRSGAR